MPYSGSCSWGSVLWVGLLVTNPQPNTQPLSSKKYGKRYIFSFKVIFFPKKQTSISHYWLAISSKIACPAVLTNNTGREEAFRGCESEWLVWRALPPAGDARTNPPMVIHDKKDETTFSMTPRHKNGIATKSDFDFRLTLSRVEEECCKNPNDGLILRSILIARNMKPNVFYQISDKQGSISRFI